jgi:hypothetical protein
MGREIRKVPENWEHPKDYRGHYKPLYDYDFNEWASQWMEDLQQWLNEYPTGFKEHNGEKWAFWEWGDGPAPDRDECRPSWKPEEMTAYQIYENVTEGTPVSPVFRTEADMRAWLRDEWTLSPEAIDHFIKLGFSFSMIMTSSGISKPGADTIEAMTQLDEC